MKKTFLSLLLLSTAVFVTPASANYFANPRLGVNLNIGSAPNPTPAQRRGAETLEERTPVYTEQAEGFAPPPPPAAPPPLIAIAPPPPAPPPPGRHFVGFFDFDKSTPRDEAREIRSHA